MHVLQGIAELRPQLGPIFVVIGVFDGMHLGHAYLLEHLVSESETRGARPTVITFDHHPDEILTGSAPPLLCDPAERLLLLERAGVEVTVVQTFDAALRMTPYDVFIRRLAERVDLAGFLMTPDSAFGHDREGTPAAVAALGIARGYDVVVVPALDIDGRPVRSAVVRAAIAAGDLAEAARLLGRPVSIAGSARRTADGAATILDPELPVALPPDGGWAARVERPGHDGTLSRRLVVADRTARLEPSVGVPDGTRLHARLPVPAESGSLRRS